METLRDVKKFLDHGYLDHRPNLTVDCAIFGYHEGDLQLLLVRNKIFLKWCLPGGYIKKSESLDEAAARITEGAAARARGPEPPRRDAGRRDARRRGDVRQADGRRREARRREWPGRGRISCPVNVDGFR